MPIPVTFLITDLHRGGSPLVLAALATGLHQRGKISPRVISIAPLGEIADLLRANNVPVKSLDARHNRDLRVLARLLGELHTHPPKILCSILIHANLLATLARPLTRDAANIQWLQSIHTLQDEPEWHWQLQGILTSFADGFIAPSHAVIQKLHGFGPVPMPVVIPNGIDIPRFRDAVAIPRTEHPWPTNSFVVGYLGRFDPVKRLPLLIDAVAQIVRTENTNLHLALVGYGATESELRQQVRALQMESRIHFIPATQEPERWLKTFDIMCSPSSAEGFGLTLVESLAAGTPVIACRAPGVLETLSNSPGVRWLPADPTKQDLIQLLEQSLVEANAVQYVKQIDGYNAEDRFSQTLMISRYEALFKQLATSSQPI